MREVHAEKKAKRNARAQTYVIPRVRLAMPLDAHRGLWW
jgi:hypothetical protein